MTCDTQSKPFESLDVDSIIYDDLLPEQTEQKLWRLGMTPSSDMTKTMKLAEKRRQVMSDMM